MLVCIVSGDDGTISEQTSDTPTKNNIHSWHSLNDHEITPDTILLIQILQQHCQNRKPTTHRSAAKTMNRTIDYCSNFPTKHIVMY